MLAIDSPRAKPLIGGAWLIFATINSVLMYVLPGEETIPYHLIWASFAFLYGLASWSARTTWTVFTAITVVTGFAIVRHASNGIIGWEECSEIVLMGVIAGLLVWHVNRHQSANRRIVELREVEHLRAHNRELATRFGSHELRTRLTIARGLTDLIRDTAEDERVRTDATLAIAELDKASSLATNLMTLVRVDGSQEFELMDLDEVIDATVHRWTARVDRQWITTPAVGFIVGNPERIEAALDCLVENAVKFTDTDDRISVDACLDGTYVVVTVSDSGQGIPADEIGLVTHLFHTSSNAGERAGSGLGLSIVRAVVEARGGTLQIASEFGVGTKVTMRVPHSSTKPSSTDLLEHPTAQTVHGVAPGHVAGHVAVLSHLVSS